MDRGSAKPGLESASCRVLGGSEIPLFLSRLLRPHPDPISGAPLVLEPLAGFEPLAGWTFEPFEPVRLFEPFALVLAPVLGIGD